MRSHIASSTVSGCVSGSLASFKPTRPRQQSRACGFYAESKITGQLLCEGHMKLLQSTLSRRASATLFPRGFRRVARTSRFGHREQRGCAPGTASDYLTNCALAVLSCFRRVCCRPRVSARRLRMARLARRPTADGKNHA